MIIFPERAYTGFPHAGALCQSQTQVCVPCLDTESPFERPWGLYRTMDQRFDDERIDIRIAAMQAGCKIEIENEGKILFPAKPWSRLQMEIKRVSDHLDFLHHCYSKPRDIPRGLSLAEFSSQWCSVAKIVPRICLATVATPCPVRQVKKIPGPSQAELDAIFEEIVEPSALLDGDSDMDSDMSSNSRLFMARHYNREAKRFRENKALREQTTTAFNPKAIVVGGLDDLISGTRAECPEINGGNGWRTIGELDQHIFSQVQNHVDGIIDNSQFDVGMH